MLVFQRLIRIPSYHKLIGLMHYLVMVRGMLRHSDSISPALVLKQKRPIGRPCLNIEPYTPPKLWQDGIFTPKTGTAVERNQTENLPWLFLQPTNYQLFVHNQFFIPFVCRMIYNIQVTDNITVT